MTQTQHVGAPANSEKEMSWNAIVREDKDERQWKARHGIAQMRTRRAAKGSVFGGGEFARAKSKQLQVRLQATMVKIAQRQDQAEAQMRRLIQEENPMLKSTVEFHGMVNPNAPAHARVVRQDKAGRERAARRAELKKRLDLLRARSMDPGAHTKYSDMTV